MKGLKAGMLCLCLWICACVNRDVVPSGIIKPEEMQTVMKDMIIADHFATQYILKDSVRQDSLHRNVKLESRQLYETVFKLHKITAAQFRQSLDFYDSRPDLLKRMFDSLSARESRYRSELYKPRNLPEEHRRDSAKNAMHRDSVARHLRDSVSAHLRDSAGVHVRGLPGTIAPGKKDSVKQHLPHPHPLPAAGALRSLTPHPKDSVQSISPHPYSSENKTVIPHHPVK